MGILDGKARTRSVFPGACRHSVLLRKLRSARDQMPASASGDLHQHVAHKDYSFTATAQISKTLLVRSRARDVLARVETTAPQSLAVALGCTHATLTHTWENRRSMLIKQAVLHLDIGRAGHRGDPTLFFSLRSRSGIPSPARLTDHRSGVEQPQRWTQNVQLPRLPRCPASCQLPAACCLLPRFRGSALQLIRATQARSKWSDAQVGIW